MDGGNNMNSSSSNSNSNPTNYAGTNSNKDASPTSAPMTSTGSKGRSGGSKLKSLLYRLGGHQKSQKTTNASAAGNVAQAGTAEPANVNSTSHNAAGKGKQATTTAVVQGDASNAVNSAAGAAASEDSKRASKSNASRLRNNNSKNSNSKTTAATVTGQGQGPGRTQQQTSGANITGDVPVQAPSSDPSQRGSPSDYFGRSALPVRQTSAGEDDTSCDVNGGLYDRRDPVRARHDGDDDNGDGESDGADADASIRPITPSSIDASSSFTGSTSLHSLAPTSRTFKSFRTGHSKTSASTKPTMLGGAGTSIQTQPGTTSTSSPSNAPMTLQQQPQNTTTSPPDSARQQRRDGSTGQSLTFQSDKGKERQIASESVDAAGLGDGEGEGGGEGLAGSTSMHDPDANRIATSLHRAEGTIDAPLLHSSRSSVEPAGALGLQHQPQSSSLHHARQAGPKASPLRNSFTGQNTSLATAPSLSAATEEDSEIASQSAHQIDSRDKTHPQQQSEYNDHAPSPGFSMPEARRTDSNLMRSSASITFSKLPPATPTSFSSAQLASGVESPSSSTADGHAHSSSARDDVEGIYHYPRHSAPDPKNNPRASSPPPDNASMLTLASSTGGRAPSVYTAASRYRDGITGGGTGSIGGAPSIVDTQGYKYRNTANEDASIRAIAPSRRGSSDSIGSRWSAAILSQKEGSFHTAAAGTTSGAGVNGTQAMSGNTGNNGELIPDSASYKKRTPSLRTVATTASSYYAAPSHATAELRA